MPTTSAARQFVAERIAQVGPQLPPGTDAPLLSSLTGRLNEIFEFTLEADPGCRDADDAARPGGVRGQEPAARGARRGRGRAARRLSARVPGADGSRAHVGARRHARRGAARGRGGERQRRRRLHRAGADGMDGARRSDARRRSTTCAARSSPCEGRTPGAARRCGRRARSARRAPRHRAPAARRGGELPDRRSSSAPTPCTVAPGIRAAIEELRTHACRRACELRIVYDQSELVELRAGRRRPGRADRRASSSRW